MTLAEKIIASRGIADARNDKVGVACVQPGDALFVRTDVRFSHEYVTPMAEALFRGAFGDDARVIEPESVFTFRDHLTFLDDVMPEAHVKLGLREQSRRPHTMPRAIPAARREQILATRRAHPYWGPRKVRAYSDEYFALLRARPELGKWLSLGRVVLLAGGESVEITEQ